MFQQTSEGVIISLHILPNAPYSYLVGEFNGALKLKINAPPSEGKANAAIERFWSEFLDVARSKVEIVKGDKSRQKKVLIKKADLQEIESKIRQALEAV